MVRVFSARGNDSRSHRFRRLAGGGASRRALEVSPDAWPLRACRTGGKRGGGAVLPGITRTSPPPPSEGQNRFPAVWAPVPTRGAPGRSLRRRRAEWRSTRPASASPRFRRVHALPRFVVKGAKGRTNGRVNPEKCPPIWPEASQVTGDPPRARDREQNHLVPRGGGPAGLRFYATPPHPPPGRPAPYDRPPASA